MKIVVDDTSAYIHLRGNNFLRLGEKREVLKATPQRIAEMVRIEMAYAIYNQLEFGEYILH